MKVLLSSIHQKRLHPGLHIADDWANLRQEHILADGFLPRDTCMSAACAVARCLSVLLAVTFVYCIKTSNCFVPDLMAILRRKPLTGESNAGGTKKGDFPPISRFISETIQEKGIVTMEY